MTFVRSMDVLNKLSSYDPRYTHLDLSQTDIKTELLQGIAAKLDENPFVTRVSWRDGSDYRVDLKKKIEDKVELNFKNFQRHPTDFIHALLSSHVYSDSKEGSRVQFSPEKDGEAAEMWNQELRKWSVLKVFNHHKAGRYYSVAYLNRDRKQVVLAHRGTSVEFWDFFKVDTPIATDIDGILGGRIVKQQEKAFVATKAVIELAKKNGWNVSFTGHSLGAWLAELGIYFAVRNFEYFQSKAVTFDSPGSASTLKSFKSNVKNDETYQIIRSLDVTTYLSAPNVVNCCNQHIGKVYRIFPIIKIGRGNEWGVRLKKMASVKHIDALLKGFLSLSGHSLRPIVATFDPVTGKPVKFEKVLDWPHIKYQPPITNNVNVGSIIPETINSVPVVNWFSGLVGWANEVVSKSTLWKVIEVFDQFISGNISCQQFCETWEHLEFEAEKGHPLKQLSPERQFTLYYEGHYCTQELNPLKDVYNSKTSDWYLYKLFKLSRRKIDKKEIEASIKQALHNLKDKYKFEVAGNMKYICILAANIDVDGLREEIINICERYKEIKEILEDKNAYSPQNDVLNQYLMIISDLPPRSGNIVERPKVLDEIEKVLSQHKFLIIRAFGGTGKSTIAKEYGRYAGDNFNGQIVRFIMAGSVDKINDAYKLMAESELKIHVTGQEPKQIMHSVHSCIAASKSSVLFIFDNVESSKDVEDYIQGISNLDGCRVIITTRDTNLGNDLNVPTYELDPFTSEEAKLYLERNLAKNRFSPEDIKYLITHLGGPIRDIDSPGGENLIRESLGEESFVLPYSLSHAVVYFNKNKLCTVKEFIGSLKKSGDPTGTVILMDLLSTSKLSFHILQYIAYLDPDFIGTELIQELFNIDADSLNDVIRKLEGLSLVNLRTLKYDKHGFQVHRLVQHCVKKYTKANQHLKAVINERQILEEILQVLSKVFPIVTQVPNGDWQLSQILNPHAVKILKNDLCCQKPIEASQLVGKLGHYNYNVACNYSEALKYHKQALALDQKLFTDQEVISNVNELNDATLKSLKHPNSPLCLDYMKNRSIQLGHTVEPHSKIAPEKLKTFLAKKNYPIIARDLTNVGLTYSKLGIFSKGLKYMEKALNMSRDFYPEKNHSDIATALDNLGRTYNRFGETAKALIYVREALEIRQALYPEINHPEIAASLNNLGLTYTKLGEAAKGVIYGKKALEMNRALHRGQNHPDSATSLDNLGMAYRKIGEAAIGLKYVEEALRMKEALYPGLNHPKIAESLNNLGLTYTKLGNPVKGLKYGEKAVKMTKTLYPGQNHPDIAFSLENLSMTYCDLGEHEKALRLAEEALEMKRALFSSQNLHTVAESLNNLGLINTKLGDAGKGLKYAKEALEINRALYPEQNHPEIASSLNNVGFCYRELGEKAKGLKYVKEALEMRQALYPAQNHPDVATSLNNVGFTYKELGQTTKGLQYSEEALKMSRALYSGRDNPNIATFLDNLGLTYTKIGETAKGLEYVEEALEMRRALYPGQSHPEIVSSLNSVCFTCGELGETAKGLKHGEEALEMSRMLHPGNHPDTVTILNNLGIFCTKIGETDKGIKYLEEGLEMTRSLYPGQVHPKIAETLTNIGLLYTKLGDTAKGQKYVKEASEIKRAL